MIYSLIFYVGLIVILKILVEIGLLVYAKYFAETNYKLYGSTEDAWAVVTGASDGIGKEFALQLAQMGYNIVLISRSKDKLEQVAKEVENISQKKTKILTIDFGDAQEQDYKYIIKEVNPLDVRILINNVGMSYKYPVYFDELELETANQILEVNIRAATLLTHQILPQMLKKVSRTRRVLVVNVSSATSLLAAPLLAVYSGSKAYINAWSESISAELDHLGVDVVTLAPWFVSTKMSKQKPSPTTPTPKAYVKESLKNLTHRAFHGGFVIHSLLTNVASVIPTYLQKIGVKSFHKMIRTKGHKKYNPNALQNRKN